MAAPQEGVVIDISCRSDDWRSAYEVIDARFGRLDILVNNAGIVRVTKLAEESLETV
ncbi:NAD(P)-dependent dehydrogenase (short-subunit alcohol dehydrogenase family) [Arthrobacter sp. GAS37]|uniref:SDR family NAD(P)-dependent oxidoreductase n=1 Tax=Arthrobacter sp. GAS37 TaxID=3156261 RepID=UPI0038367E65